MTINMEEQLEQLEKEANELLAEVKGGHSYLRGELSDILCAICALKKQMEEHD